MSNLPRRLAKLEHGSPEPPKHVEPDPTVQALIDNLAASIQGRPVPHPGVAAEVRARGARPFAAGAPPLLRQLHEQVYPPPPKPGNGHLKANGKVPAA